MYEQFSPQERHFRYLQMSWLFFSTWAVILQIFLQKKIVATTSWNYAPGWQREIGLWNVGAVVLLLLSLRAQHPVAHLTIPVICTWSGLFGLNHLVAFCKTKAHGHLTAFIANYGAIVWALLILILV